MHTEPKDSVWDLSAVIDLVHSLSATEPDPSVHNLPRHHDTKAVPNNTSTEPIDIHNSKLGNFDDIWIYLGQPLDVPPPSIVLEPELQQIQSTNGANNPDNTNKKLLRWQDEVGGADLENVDELDPTAVVAGLAKRHRKRERRRKRQDLDAAKSDIATKASSASENDTDVELSSVKRSAARSAVIHSVLGLAKPAGTPKAPVTTIQDTSTSQLHGCSVTVVQSQSWPISKPYVPRVHLPTQTHLSPDQDNLALAAQRKSKLLTLLHSHFVEDREYLKFAGLSRKVPHEQIGDPIGIHIFVDASNILIGFHDALKASMGLSPNRRIRRQPLSFHNLSLILERGRPAAKRVVVGSDNIESMDEARHLGYETSILDRVHKAKEYTPRQKRYHNSHHHGGTNGNISATTGTSGQSSGSDTNASALRAPEKWVEQAVDEILHLKILESVVDAKTPSTIVLATGDAAEAEYSGGFLKMAERALDKGWKVELVSFGRNISSAYKRREFRGKWGDSFRIVELDAFVECLLGVNPLSRP